MCGRAGRGRELQTRAEAIHQALQAEQLAAPALLADAYGAIVSVLTSLSAQIDSLHATLSKHFEHPDAEILPSLRGLGIVLGARCSASSGMTRPATPMLRPARTTRGPPRSPGRPASAGPSLPGCARNRPLADPLGWWAFCSLTCSPGARACYDRHRARGATPQQALRTLANRWVGILHGGLRHRACYDELTAWPAPHQRAA
jgi:hypothetical protein